MAKSYWLEGTATGVDITPDAGEVFVDALATSDPGAGSQTLQAANGGGTANGYHLEAVNSTVTRTSTGSFAVKFEVTVAASNTQCRCQLHRVNSSGAIQASSGYTSYQSTASTGQLTYNFTNPALGTWGSTDRLAVEFQVQNNNPHGSSAGPTYRLGTSTAETTTPFLQAFIVTVNQVTETELSQAITINPKRRLVGQITETELAQAVSARRVYPVAQITETDLAQPITVNPQRRLVNQITETELAQAVVVNPIYRLVTQVTETELAQAITVSQTGGGPAPVSFNNYLAIRVGNGMSTGDRIR